MESPLAARYREFAPCEALRQYVRALFACTGPNSGAASRPITREAPVSAFCPAVFADGHVSLVFAFGKEYRGDGIWGQGPAQPQGEAIGPMTAARPASAGQRLEMVGIYLRGGQAARFLHVPTEEFTDRVVALGDVWGSDGAELETSIGEAKDEEARIHLLESALLRQMTKRRCRTGLDVPGLAALVERRQGRSTVQTLADAAGVSRQRLTKAFRQAVGVNPKMYCRLARFRATLARARDGVNWAQVAIEMGYADQSHLIAEFREFSTVTPRALAGRRFFHPFLGR